MKLLQNFVFLSIFFIDNSVGYPDGATVQACYNFRPGHASLDVSTQVDFKNFFTLAANPTKATDKAVQVTLKAVNGDRLFKGFMIRAVPGIYNPNDWEDEPLPVGTWKSNFESRRLSCFRGENNAITHADNDAKTEATFLWLPPKYKGKLKGNVTFIATVVENYQRYFSGVDSGLINF